MARRKRREEQADSVPLDDPDHAWWAAGSIDPFAPPPTPEPEVEPAGTSSGRDPYVVLGVAPGAEWDDIVAAHRRLVRSWHPDGLGEVSAEERSYSEARFREVNEAYQELKVRKGR